MYILVVDDIKANIDVLMDTLGDSHELMVAMDRYQVRERLKADLRSAEIPVIFLTALSDIANKTGGFEVSAVDDVTEPFEILEVRARVETHLSLARARRALANQNAWLEETVGQESSC
ncbi:MAG: hypothetical protein K9L82_09845 [Chromatiaceae bacterium]|nr:hypothetical protein [Chromatiaceae bacterium]MCF7994559.1 hypothetical protein [Chromatiaceae bacterium]MCF8004459.1 hypothetical protein [Chromatiaceae bacterium]MCF8014965.1 hypothetical protein [Chromatiaceae bacterium]